MNKKGLSVIILSAGKGTRMKATCPKVMCNVLQLENSMQKRLLLSHLKKILTNYKAIWPMI